MTDKEQIQALNAALAAAKEDAIRWHNAWYEQRDATGRAYWQGYANGKKVALDWHKKEASQRKNAANSAAPSDRNYFELDARYHEYAIEHIQKAGSQ
jgi:hypothetical protein